MQIASSGVCHFFSGNRSCTGSSIRVVCRAFRSVTARAIPRTIRWLASLSSGLQEKPLDGVSFCHLE